nr:mfp1 attachment factor 1 [Quercus suber]
MADAAAPKPENSKFSFSIWPPSQRIRDAVIVRLSETLSSSDSILSNSNLYQPVPADEASSAARVIEAQAFSAADVSSVADGDVDGKIETLSVYAKEISKRALEMLKSRATQVTTEELPSVN